MSGPSSQSSRYLVGIDLGTTHTVVAYADLARAARAEIEVFPIEQLIAPGQVAAEPLLPSVRYHASLDELTEADARLPWPSPEPESDYRPIIGKLARALGSKSDGRLVTSAKSWLSHASVDRTAAILPWGAPEGIPKISPVEASASYLRHVRSAWDYHHPEAPLDNQEIVITVPASFDEAARALTLEATRLAGLPNVRLLEEPQAACYNWLWNHRKSLRQEFGEVRLLLVCDVGGGTTDLTLIKVERGEGEPALTRIAVGNHLMLGGDNIDLTLARLAERRLMGDDRKLSAAELSQLVEQCRLAKERLLAPDAPKSATVMLLGMGTRLVGGARSVELTRDEVHHIALDGFFPMVNLTDHPDRKRIGVVEFGLPYAADPAISKHLSAFLTQHSETAREALGAESSEPIPDAVLLNGGVFRSSALAQRLVQLMASWGKRRPVLLKNDRPDLAVAYGAVAYGLARHGHAVQRIGGGSARSYFLIVETGPNETPKGVCILPRGTEEGREIVLADRSFLLRLGQPVHFSLASTSEDRRFQAGELAEIDADRFVELPPLAAFLERENAQGRPEQAVQVAASLSEIGTLDLHCVAADDPARRWKIEFELRQPTPQAARPKTRRHPRLDQALEKIRLVFGKKAKAADTRLVKGLRSELEKILGPRATWDTALLRDLFSALLEGLPHRRRSAEHERLWLSLTGYCLRPGFGYPLDDWRAAQVFGIYGQGLQFVNEIQNWTEWWTCWRRLAGGLNEEAQLSIFEDLADFINPETAWRSNRPAVAKKRSYEDMVRLAAVLERLPASKKTELGNWLLQRLAKPGEPAESWWALGRVGARVPFHGSVHNVVDRAKTEEWLAQILSRDFKKEPHAGFAAALMARLSGDRQRDIDPRLRQRVIERLKAGRAPDSWVGMVSDVKELTEADEKRLFGEALPPGLKLIA